MIKAYVYDSGLLRFATKNDIIIYMMKQSFDIEISRFMEHFSCRALINKQQIRFDTQENFLADCQFYGHIKIEDDATCA